MRDDPIEEQETKELNSNNILIIDGLMRRKLKCSLNAYVKSNGVINYNLLKAKRLEENYKMVFKSAFKVLSSKFRKISKGKRSKSDEASFYNYYFTENEKNSLP